MTALAQLPAKLDQPDNPIGLGQAFIILLMIFGVIFMVLIMIGIVRSRRRTNERLDYPVLLKPEDRQGYRPTDHGRPQPRRD